MTLSSAVPTRGATYFPVPSVEGLILAKVIPDNEGPTVFRKVGPAMKGEEQPPSQKDVAYLAQRMGIDAGGLPKQ